MLAAEIVRFGVTGVAATATHLAIFAILFDAIGVYAPLANGLSAMLASVVSYVGQRYWVFGARATGASRARILRFAVSLGVAAISHAAIVWAALHLFGLDPYVGAVIAVVIVPAMSFAINRFWVFGAAA